MEQMTKGIFAQMQQKEALKGMDEKSKGLVTLVTEAQLKLISQEEIITKLEKENAELKLKNADKFDKIESLESIINKLKIDLEVEIERSNKLIVGTLISTDEIKIKSSKITN